jgi:hypothetical protein
MADLKLINIHYLYIILQYNGVKMIDGAKPDANLSVIAMVTIKGLLPNDKNVVKTAELDIVVILDKSLSMSAGSRMQTMKSLILYLINSVLKENHRLGKI